MIQSAAHEAIVSRTAIKEEEKTTRKTLFYGIFHGNSLSSDIDGFKVIPCSILSTPMNYFNIYTNLHMFTLAFILD